MAKQIIKLTFENSSERTNKLNREYTIDLGVTSKKAALLLNHLIDWKKSQCKCKVRYRYFSSNGDERVGGGLLVKGVPCVILDELDKVYLTFNDEYAVKSYVRSARGIAEVRKSILDKFGNELKKMWNSRAQNDKLAVKVKEYGLLSTSTYNTKVYLDMADADVVKDFDNNECIEIGLNEYRALYEFLKGRDKKKTIERYGKAAYDSMIGYQIEDQFVLSALETIRGEIKKATEEFEMSKKDYFQERNDLCAAAEKACNEKISSARTIMLTKINELNNQMEDMKKMAMMVVS